MRKRHEISAILHRSQTLLGAKGRVSGTRAILMSAVCCLLLVLGQTVTDAAETTPPNVVIIYADDLGYGDLHCFGSQFEDTPNLDRMAVEGRRFTSFYVAQAVCSASRTALLTGCYPNRVGIQGALAPQHNHGINANEMTLAEVLKQRGYATAIYGKWHLGHHPQFLPTNHGFDDYFGLPYSNDMWPKHPSAKFPELPLIEGTQVVQHNPDQSQLTTWYTERAIKFIEQHKAGPFFVYVPHAMPHVPLFVSEKFKGKSKNGLYGDVISEIDWSVGQILTTLKRLKLDERTLVMFASDNGPWKVYGNHAGSSGPLREGKGTAWEGGVRVPCVMRWPGHIPAGTECHDLLATIDILPTVAKLADAPLPPQPIDGLDASPLVLGKPEAKTPHDAYWFYWGDALHAIRSGPWKLHFPHPYFAVAEPGRDGQPGRGEQRRTELQLFNLEADIGERQDVAAAHPEIVKKLTALAENAREDLGDSLQKRTGKNVRPAGQLAQ